MINLNNKQRLNKITNVCVLPIALKSSMGTNRVIIPTPKLIKNCPMISLITSDGLLTQKKQTTPMINSNATK